MIRDYRCWVSLMPMNSQFMTIFITRYFTIESRCKEKLQCNHKTEIQKLKNLIPPHQKTNETPRGYKNHQNHQQTDCKEIIGYVQG